MMSNTRRILMITMEAKVSDSSYLHLSRARSPHAAVAWCISSSSSKARAQGSSPSTASSAENQIQPHISLFGLAVSLAAKCVHMPRLLHVPLVPLHVSRDVLALLADENVFPAFSLPLKRHSVRHLHILG